MYGPVLKLHIFQYYSFVEGSKFVSESLWSSLQRQRWEKENPDGQKMFKKSLSVSRVTSETDPQYTERKKYLEETDERKRTTSCPMFSAFFYSRSVRQDTMLLTPVPCLDFTLCSHSLLPQTEFTLSAAKTVPVHNFTKAEVLRETWSSRIQVPSSLSIGIFYLFKRSGLMCRS